MFVKSAFAPFRLCRMSFRVATAKQRAQIAPILAHSYGAAGVDVPPWLTAAGNEHIHAFEECGVLRGSLFTVPMAQFFGGKSVATLGVAGVAIPVPERGQGAATRMMVELLRVARARKFALSTLYPATVTLYQRVGYERGGHRYCLKVDLRQLHLPKGRLRIEEHDAPTNEVQALYRECAQRCTGYLDRSPYIWGRVQNPAGMSTRTFTLRGARGLEGYVVVNHQMQATRASKVTVVDAVAASRAGAEAIWSLLSEYQSVASDVVLRGGADTLLHALLPERHYQVEWLDTWMLRICDPIRALASRGYPPVSARINLLLSDAALPENSAAYALTISAGVARAQVTRSEKGARLTERALAALYTCIQTPWALRRLGMLECTEREAEVLAMLFAGPTPAMPDMF
jgi:predicted acetyltransferase